MSDKLRKQMKTEEAHRVTVMADELTEEWGELSMYAGMDAFLSYFFDERVGLLDYFDPSDSLIFFDELTRCTEQGKLTETEFSEHEAETCDGIYTSGADERSFYREGDCGKAREVFVYRTRCAR